MSDINLLGEIKSFDPLKEEITIKCDYVNTDKWQIIEDSIGKQTTFKFTKPNMRLKSHEQLKKYFRDLKLILIALKVRPTVTAIKEIDRYIKTSLIECDTIEFIDEVDGKEKTVRIPIIPSKADMTVEKMSDLIQALEETYDYLNINWNGDFE